MAVTVRKNQFAGSVGAGMQSLFTPGGRTYYVLEHKLNSSLHKAGEKQEIIIDYIELGRDPKCQVRFDETFTTVSRKHAAIVKDGGNWKIRQLSKVNDTLLNGRPIKNEWFLQNGDEIQLSVGGPKLGFLVPSNNTVGSIGLSRRLSLFRQQALRPYKKALTILASFFVLCAFGGGFVIFNQEKKIEEYRTENITIRDDFYVKLSEAQKKRQQDSIAAVETATQQQAEFAQQIAMERQKTDAAIAEANRIASAGGNSSEGVTAMLEQQNIYKDVYYLQTEKVVCILDGKETVITNVVDGKQVPYGWGGTGFLLDDGRFVTARHCIEGWWYQNWESEDMPAQVARAAASDPRIKIKAYLTATSSKSKTQFKFTSDDFRINRELDKVMQIGTNESGNAIKWRFTFPAINDWEPKMWATDWAYTTQTNGKTGSLKADGQLSKSLLPMQKLIVLGFPQGIGVMDGNENVEPISNELTTSRRGLANNGCILHSRGTDHGNSGGPIFTIADGKLIVIGIVSRGDYRTSEHNWAVPISNIY